MLVDWLAAAALAAWLVILVLPSRPWSTRERLEPDNSPGSDDSVLDLRRVTALIPARNEAAAIGATLGGLADQGVNLKVIIIDDQSDDDTATAAINAAAKLSRPVELAIIDGKPLPDGWGGKLWALQQGLARADREFCLLLDAEIVLASGVVAALLTKADSDSRAMVSVMAKLRCETFWEKLLVPPFIFFFRLLYPFAKVNSHRQRTAAAAGGCILVRTNVLRQVGGFASIRDALIDDCALAARIKRAGHSIWLGMSHSVTSTRAYPDLASFRRMVTRTAFTQLWYSATLLVLVCLLMLTLFLMPFASLVFQASSWGMLVGVAAIIAMASAFWPTVRFYNLALGWVLTLPLAAFLFMLMTIESALSYWRGVKAEWKGRTYSARSR